MYIIYNMILFLLEPSTIFYYSIWLCDSMLVKVTCDVTPNPNPSSKSRKIKIKIKIKLKEKIK